MTDATKARILDAVRLSAGGYHSESVFTADEVIKLVGEALNDVPRVNPQLYLTLIRIKMDALARGLYASDSMAKQAALDALKDLDALEKLVIPGGK